MTVYRVDGPVRLPPNQDGDRLREFSLSVFTEGRQRRAQAKGKWSDVWARFHAEHEALTDPVEKRRRRWRALHEDGPIFCLTSAEEAELQRLDQEFGDWP